MENSLQKVPLTVEHQIVLSKLAKPMFAVIDNIKYVFINGRPVRYIFFLNSFSNMITKTKNPRVLNINAFILTVGEEMLKLKQLGCNFDNIWIHDVFQEYEKLPVEELFEVLVDIENQHSSWSEQC
jgi:hypothetical protein